MGAYIRTNGGVVPAKAAQFLPGPYRIRDVALTVEAFVTSKTPVGTLRAPGPVRGEFLSRAAARHGGARSRPRSDGIPPQESASPRRSCRSRPASSCPTSPRPNSTPATITPPSSARSREIGWESKKHLQGQLIEGRYHGLAAVPFVESGGSGKENCRVVIEQDGAVTVYVGSSVLGQGLETTLAQVAADTLKLPFERIKILHGSTTYVREGFGTFASRSMVVGGSAVMDGCNNLLAAIRAAAAERLGFPNEEIAIADGIVARRRQAGEARRVRRPRGGGHASRPPSAPTAMARMPAMSRSMPAPATSKSSTTWRSRTSAVAINPHIVHGQAIGALVQGLGGVFLDQIMYDRDAQMLNASLADYLVPLATDFSNVRAITMELRRSKTNPLGAKGAGEGGMVAVAATMANAVAAALAPLGIELRELPLSPANIWRLVAKSGERPAV